MVPEKRGPAPEEERRDGAPGGARVLERERGTQRTMVAPPGAPSPSHSAGDRKKAPLRRGKATAHPAPQRNRVAERWLRLFDN